MCELNNNMFPFLTPDEYLRLTDFFSKSPNNFMPHQLAVTLGIELHKAITILTVMTSKKIIDVSLLIYHICDDEMPVGSLPYGTGFPALPWHCPNCEDVARDYSDLQFDFMAMMKKK